MRSSRDGSSACRISGAARRSTARACVEPVGAQRQLDLDLGPRLDPLRLGVVAARRAAARRAPRAPPSRSPVDERQPGAHVAPEDARVGDRLAGDPRRQRGARLREPPEPEQQPRLLHREERVEAGALGALAGARQLRAHDLEPLRRAADDVEQLRQVDRGAALVGGRGERAAALVGLAHVRDALVLLAEHPAREAERRERAHLGELGADGAGVGERLRDRRQRLLVVAHQHLDAGARLEHARALGDRVGREQRDGAVERGQAVAAGAALAQVAAEPQVQPGRAHRVGVLAERRQRLADQRDRARRLAAGGRARRGLAQQLGAVHAGALLGVGHALPQLERAARTGGRPPRRRRGASRPGPRARSRRARGSARARRASGRRARRRPSPPARRRAAPGARRARPRCARAAPCPRPAAGRCGRPRRRARGGSRTCPRPS